MPSSNKNKKPKTGRKYGQGWKSQLTDLDLPSGELCQVKRPGVQGLINAGVLESLDTLTSIVNQETLPKAQNKKQADVSELLKDPDKYNKMMETVDKIVIHCVVQPKIHPGVVSEREILDPTLPFSEDDLGRDMTDEEVADLGQVSIKWIDEFDKMFIMNFVVGGSRDLESFRSATQNALGSAPAIEEVSSSGK